MTDSGLDLDTDIRLSLNEMNTMFDTIITNGNISPPSVPSVDIATSQDFPAIEAMLRGKLTAIGQSYDTSLNPTRIRYDATTLKNQITFMRGQLEAVRSENASLLEALTRQERAVRLLARGNGAIDIAKENVCRLRENQTAAEHELKLIEETHIALLAENRCLCGRLQAAEKAEQEMHDLEAPKDGEALTQMINQLQLRQEEIDTRHEKKKSKAQARFRALQEELDVITKRKAALERRLREQQKEFDLIHGKMTKRSLSQTVPIKPK
jgi:chromosome segregation ATPase